MLSSERDSDEDACRGDRRAACRRRRVAGDRRLAWCRRTAIVPRRPIGIDGLWWRAALVGAAFVVAFAVTGWPAAGVLAGACGLGRADAGRSAVDARSPDPPQRGGGRVGRDAARHDRLARRPAGGDRGHGPGGACSDSSRGAGTRGPGRAGVAHGRAAAVRRRHGRPGGGSRRRVVGDRRRTSGPTSRGAARADRRCRTRAGRDAAACGDGTGPHVCVVEGAGRDHASASRSL